MTYTFLRPLLNLYTALFYPFKVYGKENRIDGKQVIVCNHFGNIDGLILHRLYKGRTHCLAKKELFGTRFMRWLMRVFGCIPVLRDSVDYECIKSGLKVLKQNERLGIFPEGMRNLKDYELLPLKPGSAMFAFKGKAPVVPIIFEKKFKAFGRNRVMIGKPLYFDAYYGLPFTAELSEELNEKVRRAMLETQAEFRALLAEKKRRK